MTPQIEAVCEKGCNCEKCEPLNNDPAVKGLVEAVRFVLDQAHLECKICIGQLEAALAKLGA